MKILFLQLARLGDIYQTWPALNSAVREGHEVHVVVRKRFEAATVGLDESIRVHVMDTATLLQPVFESDDGLEECYGLVSNWVEALSLERFDKVVNLSYSPASSYLTHYLHQQGSDVVGYSRHNDGFFFPKDDVSAYFYAQVGIEKSNRYHLTEVFASAAGLKLAPEDWRVSGSIPFFEKKLPEHYIVIHPGASQESKKWPSSHWHHLIAQIMNHTDWNVVIVGIDSEDQGLQVFSSTFPERVLNLVGKTRVSDLIPIVNWAGLCIGSDSVVMQIASLTETKCINLSSQDVNFWETGPCSKQSRVIWSRYMSEITSDRVFNSVCEMVADHSANGYDEIVVSPEFAPVKYKWSKSGATDFEWKFIQALYTGEAFPTLDDVTAFHALYRIKEFADLALGGIQQLKAEGANRELMDQMSMIDEGIEQVGKMNRTADILVKWFSTEKIRLAPQDIESLIAKTERIYNDLKNICRVFVGDEKLQFAEGSIYADEGMDL